MICLTCRYFVCQTNVSLILSCISIFMSDLKSLNVIDRPKTSLNLKKVFFDREKETKILHFFFY